MEPLLDARALVAGWLTGEDEFVTDLVRDADEAHLRRLCMSLTGMMAGIVTALAEAKGEDPIEVWRRGIAGVRD